jgi:hypothetical protein
VAEARQLSETGLLAALLLPGILLRRYDVEAIERRPLTRQALRELVEESVTPFFARFVLSNVKSHAVLHALHDFNRMCEPGWKPGDRVRFAHRPSFEDAVFLFELLVEATGDGREELAEWRLAVERRGHRPKPAAPPLRRPRRRRRRPRP